MKKLLLFFSLMTSFVCYAQDNNGRENDINQIKQAKHRKIEETERRRIIESFFNRKRGFYSLLHMYNNKTIDFGDYPRIISSPTFVFLDAKQSKSIGFTYNYGKHYPYGASLNYSYCFLMLSLDFGINNDRDKYYENNKDEINYTKMAKYLDPKYFLSLSLNAGYDYVFKFKEKSGLGLQWGIGY